MRWVGRRILDACVEIGVARKQLVAKAGDHGRDFGTTELVPRQNLLR